MSITPFRLFILLLFTAFIPAIADSNDRNMSRDFKEFIAPGKINLLQNAIRFGALDLSNDVIIDDYAKIVECDLYETFFKDDFKWQKIRAGLRDKIKREIITYPLAFYVVGTVELDRYDFENKIFRFSEDKKISGVNALPLFSFPQSSCGKVLKVIPTRFIAILDTQLHIPGLVMDEADASALLERMSAEDNETRSVWVKFNFYTVFVDKINIDYTKMDAWGNDTSFVGKNRDARIYSRIDSIEFYEDAGMTRRIYLHRPAQ